MGKRTSYAKHIRDYYATPPDAIKPLVPFIKGMRYAEPCVGGGHLVQGINLLTFRLKDRPVCVAASDLSPDWENLALRASHLDVKEKAVQALTAQDVAGADVIVTNPPYTWNVLSALIERCVTLKPTWLLLPSDMACNVRFAPYMEMCSDVVPIGRVSWMGNAQSGMENSSWYCFDASWTEGHARLHPRR